MKYNLFLLTLGLVSLTGVVNAEPTSTGYVEVDTATSYVWRGDLYSQDLFDPNFQTLVEVKVNNLGTGALYTNVLGYWPITGEAFEIDPRVGYVLPLAKWLEADIAYTAYIALNPVDDYMYEISLDLSVFNGYLLYPVAGVAIDTFVTNGVYSYSGLTTSFGGEKTTSELKLTGGVSGYEGIDFGIQDVTLSGNVFRSINKTFSVGTLGAVAYAVRTKDINPWIGIAIGAGF